MSPHSLKSELRCLNVECDTATNSWIHRFPLQSAHAFQLRRAIMSASSHKLIVQHLNDSYSQRGLSPSPVISPLPVIPTPQPLAPSSSPLSCGIGLHALQDAEPKSAEPWHCCSVVWGLATLSHSTFHRPDRISPKSETIHPDRRSAWSTWKEGQNSINAAPQPGQAWSANYSKHVAGIVHNSRTRGPAPK